MIPEDNIDEKRRIAKEALDRVELNGLPRFYVPTRGRSDRVNTLASCPALSEFVTLVFDEDQEDAYDLYLPDIDRLVIPMDAYGSTPSIGRSRRYILEHAKEDHIITLDDDLLSTRLMAQKPGGGVTTMTLQNWSVEDSILACLALFSEAMETAYEASPRTVMGAPQSAAAFPRTFARESSVRWQLNVQDPSFCISFRRDRWWDLVDYHLDLDRYGPGAIGEDKGLTLAAMAAGCSIVDVPSILMKTNYAGLPGDTQVVRTRESYVRASANYRQYPEKWFTKPRWSDELQEFDSWNITFKNFKKDGADRDLTEMWVR